jgi:glycosyltransferase involved in cell wall biosynthesis
VEFCGSRLDIPALLQDAWGFVLPSRWEGMPNALLEAMACALPCIATRVSGSEDVLEQAQNGLLVEAERPRQLAYALRLLLEDVDLAMHLGWSGYETVLRYYQLSTTVQGCVAFYRYLLSRETAHRIWPDPVQFDDLSPWRQGYE